MHYSSVWSSAIVSCAIGLLFHLHSHHQLTSAQLLFAAPSNIQQQYQPLINVAFPQNETVEANSRKSHGWTPVPANRNAPNSAYTAIQPPSSSSSVPVSSSAMGATSAKFAAPVAASLSPVSATNPNSTYIFSESVARSSYQKPQSTYMIQPAKYRQAFPSSRSSNSTKSSKSTGSRKSNKSSKLINSEVMPIPMIKPHRHGATLGFNLPDQGLTLYLDINELATKPMAQNIGLKVVSHGKNGEDEEETLHADSIESLNEVKPQGEGKSLRKRVTKVKRLRDSAKNVTSSGAAKSTSLTKNFKLLQSQNDTKIVTTTPTPAYGTKKIKYTSTKTKSSNTSGGNKINIPSPAQMGKAKSQVIEIPSLNHEVSINPNKIFDDINLNNKANRSDIPPTASRIPATYVSQVGGADYKSGDEELEQKNIIQQKAKDEDSGEEEENETDSTKETVSSGEALSGAVSGAEIEREKRPAGNEEADDDETDAKEEKSPSSTPSSTDNDEAEDEEEAEDDPALTTTVTPTSEEISDGVTTVDPLSSTSQPVEEALRVTTTTIPLRENDVETTTSTLNASGVKRQEVADNRFVSQMQTLIEKSAKLLDLSSQQCSAAVERCKRSSCEPNFKSMTTESATTVREIAQQLDADLILNEIGNAFESELQDSVDFSTSGYTVLLPSNDAVRRLPPNLLRRWKERAEGLPLDVYLLDGAHTLESLVAKKMIETRARVKLHFGNPHNDSYTINGQRVVHANQKILASGGIVHVIDGLLYPHSDKDIIDTLKACGRLDGFVTLAEGTGFAATLKKEGPFTVFVPSNDALQKVPDNDLELIRRNMTALREFLKYHVAQGIYYSQDLIDGQFLPSLLDGEYLQAGVRVDGCQRRLVEVNVSPLYRADIPASNGVIHVVDWILKPEDRDWCNGVILPRRR